MYEIGGIFNKSFWRQGFAYEACANTVSYAFAEMNVDKIIGETIDTLVSVRLMKKLGMELKEIKKNAAKYTDGNWADMYIRDKQRQ